jgi:plastocyanin
MKVLKLTTISQSLSILGIPFLLLLSAAGLGWASNQPLDVKVTMDYWAPYYSPVLAIVPEGASIHIVNPTSSPHTLTHDGCRISGPGPCAFDTGAVQPGQDFTIPSLSSGRYSYFCALHPIMKGEIIVMTQQPLLSQTPNNEHLVITHNQKDQ